MSLEAKHAYTSEADAESAQHYHVPLRVHYDGNAMLVPVLRYAWWNGSQPGIETSKRDWAHRHVTTAVQQSWQAFGLMLPSELDWNQVQAWIVAVQVPQFRRRPSAIYLIQRLGDWAVELCLTDEMVLGSSASESYQRGIIQRFRAKCRTALAYGRDPGFTDFRHLSLTWLRYGV